MPLNSEFQLIPELEQALYTNTDRRYKNAEDEIQHEVIGSDERMPVAESRWAPFHYICQIIAPMSIPGCSAYEVQREESISKLKIKLVGYHPTEERSVTYFESKWLG